jgi:hypothetical protein
MKITEWGLTMEKVLMKLSKLVIKMEMEVSTIMNLKIVF